MNDAGKEGKPAPDLSSGIGDKAEPAACLPVSEVSESASGDGSEAQDRDIENLPDPSSRGGGNKSGRALLFAGFLASVAGLGALLYRLDATTHPPAAGMLSPPKPLAGFELTDHRGANLGLGHLRGRWSLIFFGYTHCPDICPPTLAELARLYRRHAQASPASHPLQVWFVSVDPQRDDRRRLADYVPRFHEDFTGLGGQPAAIADFARQFGVYASERPTSEDTALADDPHAAHAPAVLLSHTTSVFLIAPDASLVSIFSAPHRADDMLPRLLATSRHWERQRS